MSEYTVDEGIVLQSNGIVENCHTFEDIDRADTIGDFIDKVNRNFDKISFLLEPQEEDSDDMHDLLCDAVWIKPHQVVHRRKTIAGAGNRDDLMSTEWLKYVDYVYGDLAIVEQKRLLKKGNDVYMFTIKKEGEKPILTNKTLLSGPPGEDGVISSETLDSLLQDGIGEITVNNINCQNIYVYNDNGEQTIIINGNDGSIICNEIYVDYIHIQKDAEIYIDDDTSYKLSDKHNFEWGRVFMGLKGIESSYAAEVPSIVPCDETYSIEKKGNDYILKGAIAGSNGITSNLYKNVYDALYKVYGTNPVPIPKIDCMYNDLIYYMTLY